MGAGKTTVGRRLAETLRWPFVDLDAAVEAAEGASVPEIFATRGERSFREAETRALGRALAQSPLVLALGGGTLDDPGNRERVRADTTLVFLDAPPSILRARLDETDAGRRPLLAGGFPRALYDRRLGTYRQAPVIVRADAPVETVVTRVVAALEALGLPGRDR